MSGTSIFKMLAENSDEVPLIFRLNATCTRGFPDLSEAHFSTIEKGWLISQIGSDLSCLDIICNRYTLPEATKNELRNSILEEPFPFLDGEGIAILQTELMKPRMQSDEENILRIFRIMKEQQGATLRDSIVESARKNP